MSRRSRMLLVGALLALAVGLGLWSGVPLPPGAAPAAATPTPADGTAGSAAAAPARANGPAAAGQADAAPAPAPERQSARPPVPADGVLVRVVDASGAGVGEVPVQATCCLAGAGDEQQLTTARTDADGYATLTADALRLQQLRAAAPEIEFAVVADVPLAPQPRAVLGAALAAAEVVTLQLPACGSVIVFVRDRAGAEVDDGGDVFLFWRALGSTDRWDRIGTPRAPSRGGRAQLPFVPLGKQLLLRASGNERLQSGEVMLAGPARAGELVTAELRLGLPWAFVTGRLVDERGAPLSGSVLVGIGQLAADAPPDQPPPREHTDLRWQQLDGDGRFRRRAPLAAAQGQRLLLLVEDRGGAREAVRTASAPLPAALASGAAFDVGTLVLAAPPERLLVAGRAVDEAGAPLALAEVSAGYWDRDAGRWVPLHRQRVRSDADGRFAIRSTAGAPPAFRVSAALQGRVRADVEARDGQDDLRLVLAPAGSLSARIVAPPGVPPHLLVGSAIDAGGNRREPNQWGGAFTAENLAPGRYDVAVRITDSPWELVRVQGVEVPAGGKADDERLRAISVAGRCGALRLRLVDGARLPRANLTVQIVDAQGRGVQRRSDAQGRVAAVVPLPAQSFTLIAGEQRAVLAVQTEEQIVVLP